MRRVMAAVAATLMLGSSQALAQGRPLVEIGAGAGLTVATDGSTVTMFSVPGAGILGQPAIYASFFTPGGLVIEPSTALNIVHASGSTATTLGLGTMVGHFFQGTARNSAFVGAVGTLQHLSGGGTNDTNYALGARVGYRWVPPGSGLGIRVQGGYQRWLRYGGASEITLGVELGGILHSSK